MWGRRPTSLIFGLHAAAEAYAFDSVKAFSRVAFAIVAVMEAESVEVLGGDVALGLVEAAGAAAADHASSHSSPSSSNGNVNEKEDDHDSSDDSSSSSEGESFETPVQKLIRQLRSNYKGTTAIDLVMLCQDEWDYLEEDSRCEGFESDGEYEPVINYDIASIFQALEDNTIVEKVDLNLLLEERGCKITRIGAKAIAQSLSKNNSVRELHIAGPAFVGEQGIRIVLEGLTNSNTSVKKLTISGNDRMDILENGASDAVLRENGMQALSDLLIGNASIEVLELINNACRWTSSRDLASFCNALRKNLGIKMLNIIGNDFLVAGRTHGICDSVGGSGGVRCQFDADGQLVDLLHYHRNIEEIYIRPNADLDDDEWMDLARAIKLNGSIKNVMFLTDWEVVEYHHNEGLFEVVSALAQGALEKLSFRSIPLGDEGLCKICEVLRASNTIRDLTFDNCSSFNTRKITLRGASALAELLRANKTLESVDMSGIWPFGIEVGNLGAIALADAIVNRKAKTKKIRLHHCNIGDTGGIVLCRLLDNPDIGIETLELGQNQFSFSVCEEFAKCLRTNSTLKALDLSGDREDDDADRDSETKLHVLFFDSLRTNRSLEQLLLPCSNFLPYWADSMVKGRVFKSLLEVNHTITDVVPMTDSMEYIKGRMRNSNSKHPILASTMKGVPFPAYFTKDLSEVLVSEALEWADNVAGIDGVFSLLRQVGDNVARFASRSTSEKRGRED